MTNISPATHILVVDDDRNLLNLLQDTLHAIGYKVTPAQSGAEALELLTEKTFDLMITDIKMPDIDGFQLFRKVRRQFSKMPVLFITGVASQQILSTAEADGFLAKPFRISQIEKLIRQALAKRDGNTDQHSRHVLIVDRDKYIRDHLSETLSMADYLPFTAGSADEARRELTNGTFDVVIADESLGELADFTPIDTSRGYRPIPMILTTDTDTKPDLTVTDPSRQIRGRLKKPFKASELISLLSEIETEPSEN